MFARVTVLSCVLSVSLSGCASNACTPGRVESCPCLGGGVGVQQCLADGTFGSCTCEEAVDAAVPTDAGLPDTPVVADVPLGDDTSIEPDAPVDVTGHAVLIGGYPFQPDEAFDRMIANAVLVSERTGDVAVTEYMEHAVVPGWEIQARLHAAIDQRAEATGRTVTYTDLDAAFDLPDVIGSTDVLLIHGQTYAPAGWMNTVSMAWHDDLVAFLDAGGVVVVLAAQHEEHRVLSGAGLFGLPAASLPFNSVGTTFTVVAPTDPIVTDVLSPFLATEVTGVVCFMGSTGGSVVARETVGLCPVVRHLEL